MRLSISKAASVAAAAALLAGSVTFAAESGSALAPLKGAIRLDRALHPGSTGGYAPRRATLGAIQQKYVQFKDGAAGYESGLKHSLRAEQECAAKSYSVQDQTAAGCSASEPLSLCMDKLYKRCFAATVRRDGGATQNFQQSAATAAAAARALSQLLDQYATDADQNAMRFAQ
ncbi:MAG TPA: hypothetical protein VLX30_02930 [Burkholderiales bacterium]|nr:hypothetical protein [Burkholderiales bacterium]